MNTTETYYKIIQYLMALHTVPIKYYGGYFNFRAPFIIVWCSEQVD